MSRYLRLFLFRSGKFMLGEVSTAWVRLVEVRSYEVRFD
jgi:hypothetical protein